MSHGLRHVITRMSFLLPALLLLLLSGPAWAQDPGIRAIDSPDFKLGVGWTFR